jgi:hypothetical protein
MIRLWVANGLTIGMYRIDHPPPHVHLYYGAFDAVMRISDGSVLAGRIPKRQLREARDLCSTFRGPWIELFNRLNPPRHA